MGGKQKRKLLPESTSHHPEFLDKTRQLQRHTLSSSTDCNNKHSSNKIGQEALSLSSPVLELDVAVASSFVFPRYFSQQQALVNLAMFTRGHLSKTSNSPTEPVAFKLLPNRTALYVD